uniref:vacuolar protein sorting-associated protein 8 homolog isoform X2 n=1 Tax=Myxine glutinosa TaxID=7769 RepID=UPI00358DF74C
MAGFIAIPSILLRLLQDPAYSTSKFGEVKDLMLTMLETFNYEKTLLSTTTDLIRHDLHWALSQLRGTAARGLHPRGEACCLCGQAFRHRHRPTGDRKLIVFGCGHGYHADCLAGAMRAGSCTPGAHLTSIPSMNCYLCHASQAGSQRKSDTHLSQHSKLDVGTKDKRQEKQRKKVVEVTMDQQQVQALEALHNVSSGPSRIAVLAELARSREQDSTPARGAHGTSDPNSVLFNKSFQLRLVPPPLRD